MILTKRRGVKELRINPVNKVSTFSNNNKSKQQAKSKPDKKAFDSFLKDKLNK